MVSIKKLEKNNFYFKSLPAEVMMGPKFAIAKVSLMQVAVTEHKMEDVHALS